MRFDILTIFPEMFEPLRQSIIGRGVKAGHIEINYVNFREYTTNKHRRVDDSPFGGGAGLVLTAQPIVDCIEAIDPKHEAHRIFMTPAAPVFTQKRAVELSKKSRIIILCGHYEGVDQRAIDICMDEVLSIGNFVLTGGELPAMCVVDAVARQVPGVLKAESLDNESFTHGDDYHEAPQYTRPRSFRGKDVPEILLSGNHKNIKTWQRRDEKK